MYIYAPATLHSTYKSPILVDLHGCNQTVDKLFLYSNWPILGDAAYFITIYPNASNNPDQCWDVSSEESLTHEGGGDAQGIVSMVRWTLANYPADPDRVFVTGAGSGAMMTNVLLGSYPDIFAAGSAWSGVPFGCFAADGYDVWSDECASGKIIKSGSEWGTLVRNAYPGYTGFRPKVQTLHGRMDTRLSPQNLKEQVKQWVDVLGLDPNATEVKDNTPKTGWTRIRYGNKLEVYDVRGVEDVPNDTWTLADFFNLTCVDSTCYSRKNGNT